MKNTKSHGTNNQAKSLIKQTKYNLLIFLSQLKS